MFAEGAEVAVIGLGGDEAIDNGGGERCDALARLHAHGLDGGDEVFADEFTRPRDEVGCGLTIAKFEHCEHAWIGSGSGNEPVVDVGLESIADPAFKDEASGRSGRHAPELEFVRLSGE